MLNRRHALWNSAPIARKTQQHQAAIDCASRRSTRRQEQRRSYGDNAMLSHFPSPLRSLRLPTGRSLRRRRGTNWDTTRTSRLREYSAKRLAPTAFVHFSRVNTARGIAMRRTVWQHGDDRGSRLESHVGGARFGSSCPLRVAALEPCGRQLLISGQLISQIGAASHRRDSTNRDGWPLLGKPPWPGAQRLRVRRDSGASSRRTGSRLDFSDSRHSELRR